MKKQLFSLSLILLVASSTLLFSQSSEGIKKYWQLNQDQGIVWYPDAQRTLPYQDNIEMAGKKVAAIIYYEIDDKGNLQLKKDVIFPQLRTYNKSNEPAWKKYRAYFRRTADNELKPGIFNDNLQINPTQVDSIVIDGMIRFYYSSVNGIQLAKTIYPAMDQRLLVEEWTLINTSEESKAINIAPVLHSESELGYKGTYTFFVKSESQSGIQLAPGAKYSFPVFYGATLNAEKHHAFSQVLARKSREAFLKTCKENLVLDSPDPIFNQLFYFSKIRASESIFESSMGYVHSPGGGNYYVGVWANDQVEYSGPFFPYLDYDLAQEAAFNTYQKFLENIPADPDAHIAYAFEVDGNFPMTHLDRGDAAMIAYGTALYLLNAGDEEQAQKLWPLIEWALDYCERMKNDAGAIQSESDEMEGRIETGDANLSTSTLYYGGLKYSIPLANALGKPKLAKTYQKRLKAMEKVVDTYFGATIDGLETYRYFDGNQEFRHWICLPLTMGIEKRKAGTLEALFTKLWTDNGVLVQYNPAAKASDQVFWDRATLYALRGALKVGENTVAMERLRQYSTKRLLGDHVPYPVEAYPENNMKHLSAESALYSRIFMEGMLGIEPSAFGTISIQPNLPADWKYLHLNQVLLCGKKYDISIEQISGEMKLNLKSGKGRTQTFTLKPGEQIIIDTRAN